MDENVVEVADRDNVDVTVVDMAADSEGGMGMSSSSVKGDSAADRERGWAPATTKGASTLESLAKMLSSSLSSMVFSFFGAFLGEPRFGAFTGEGAFRLTCTE
jgi:hypothetical protein